MKSQVRLFKQSSAFLCQQRCFSHALPCPCIHLCAQNASKKQTRCCCSILMKITFSCCAQGGMVIGHQRCYQRNSSRWNYHVHNNWTTSLCWIHRYGFRTKQCRRKFGNSYNTIN